MHIPSLKILESHLNKGKIPISGNSLQAVCLSYSKIFGNNLSSGLAEPRH